MKRTFSPIAHRRHKMNCTIVSDAHNAHPNRAQFVRWIDTVRAHFHAQVEVSVSLFDEEKARSFNRDYRQKDYATNILSFVLEEFSPPNQPVICGDLLICPAVVEREAREQDKNLTAHYAHLTIHGMLHLAGFDHIQEDEAQVMEDLEIQLLAQLNYANPY